MKLSTHVQNYSALTRVFGVRSIDLDFIRDHAEKVLKSTTVAYLKTVRLRGSLFQKVFDAGVVLSVFTNFFVDHKEPLAALCGFEEKGEWCLGELLDGHEYLVILSVPTEAARRDSIF